MLQSISTILVILVSFTAIVASKEIHKCNHDEIKADLQVQDLPNEPLRTLEQLSVDSEKKRRLQGTETVFKPIRITFDLAGLAGLEAAKYDLIVNQVLPAAKRVFESFVSVVPLTSPIVINGKTCYQAPIDAKYQTTGAADTDLLIFVTYDTNTTNLLAWATACVLGNKIGHRPIAGQINFAALNLQTGDFEFQNVLKTVLHEMIHVLVFSPSLFSYYINANGSAKGESRQAAVVRGTNTTIVTLKSIVSWVRNHLNCSSVQGAELENQGTSASKGAHWERRIFGNELMTSSLSHDAVLSNLTLNLFEESGWYYVDHSVAGELNFGKNLGCDFVNGSCLVNNKSAFPGTFCDTVNVETCSSSYKSKAACPLGQFGMSIPSTFDYFGDGKTGSNDMFADNCPVIQNTDIGDCTNPTNMQAGNTKFFDEVYGGSSRCFSGTFIKETAAVKGYKAFSHGTCLKSKCESGTLTVTLGSTNVICPVAGGPVSVPGYRGTFNCPAAADFCKSAFDNLCGVDNCGGVGLCIAGKCYCPTGVPASLCDPTWTAATNTAKQSAAAEPAVATNQVASTNQTATASNTAASTNNAASTSSSANTDTNANANANAGVNGTIDNTASSGVIVNGTSNETISFAPITAQAKSGSILDNLLCSYMLLIFVMQYLL